MIAAVYVRKSTEQIGVASEQKSITRQIDHARRYADRKGWTIDDASIFVDDGISGAEFANRPGFLRLMNALKPRPTFQVLVCPRNHASVAKQSCAEFARRSSGSSARRQMRHMCRFCQRWQQQSQTTPLALGK
jgi:hypothetical protein